MSLSLWIVPPPDEAERYAHVLRGLATRFGTDAFAPHVTVVGGLDGLTDEEVLEAATAVAAATSPFEVRLTHATGSAEHFRALVLEAEHSPELMDLNRRAREALPRAEDRDPFRPHLSLLYGDVPEVDKQDAVTALPDDLPRSFPAAALTVFSTEGSPPEWRLVDAFVFGRRLP